VTGCNCGCAESGPATAGIDADEACEGRADGTAEGIDGAGMPGIFAAAGACDGREDERGESIDGADGMPGILAAAAPNGADGDGVAGGCAAGDGVAAPPTFVNCAEDGGISFTIGGTAGCVTVPAAAGAGGMAAGKRSCGFETGCGTAERGAVAEDDGTVLFHALELALACFCGVDGA